MLNASVSVHRRQFGGTFIIGDLNVNGRRIGQTLEYPWRGNTAWDSNRTKGENFRHVSSVREGIYHAQFRTDHKGARLELVGTAGRTAIEIHSGNTLIRDSEGCILCGSHVFHANGVEPRIIKSRITLHRFVNAFFGDLSSLKNPSEWAAKMGSVRATVRIIGMPPKAWDVH